MASATKNGTEPFNPSASPYPRETAFFEVCPLRYVDTSKYSPPAWPG